MKVLVIAPHHDDAEFGMGGYISALCDDPNNQVHIGVLCHGDYTSASGVKVLSGTREKESILAYTVLSGTRSEAITYSFCRVIPENGALETTYGVVVSEIEAMIEEIAPDEVFIPLPSFNQDHEVVYKAAITATRPNRYTPYPRLWAYEYPGNCWSATPKPSTGRCYVSLEERHIDRKVGSLYCHASQFNTENLTGAVAQPENSRILAVQRGAEVGRDFAECFWLLREVYDVS